MAFSGLRKQFNKANQVIKNYDLFPHKQYPVEQCRMTWNFHSSNINEVMVMKCDERCKNRLHFIKGVWVKI